ncbi:MAG: CSLREA domain-containing protein, partial [Chloroflexi bacterium]|nr:CSLREA domain-containing protein [Chloroflexota bacterium]
MKHVRILLLGLVALVSLFLGPAPVAQAATFTVDSTGDAVDANPGDGACATAGAVCTLRAAIQEANALVGTDIINFTIGTGVQTITPGSTLPTITQPVTIDGTTQPGFTTTPIIELNGSGAGAFVDGLNITAGGTTVKGLVINNFSGNGIKLSNLGGNTIEGNFIGTDVTGAVAEGNGARGVYVIGSPSNMIGGTTAEARNVISGNILDGVRISAIGATLNVLEGNYIGT